MGASANDALSAAEAHRVQALAEGLGAAIARADCILITGATTGLPDLVAQAFRNHGGFALGVSPAENRSEHVGRYGLPDDGADVIIYTGFGYKGRNVINVRSADIVLIIGGATGTLNEFTIAYDEGQDHRRARRQRRCCRSSQRDHRVLQETERWSGILRPRSSETCNALCRRLRFFTGGALRSRRPSR